MINAVDHFLFFQIINCTSSSHCHIITLVFNQLFRKPLSINYSI